MQINKTSIQEEVENGDTLGAIQMLMKLAMPHDELLHRKAILLSARYNSMLKQHTDGFIDDDNVIRTKKQLKFGLNKLLEEVSDDWVIS